MVANLIRTVWHMVAILYGDHFQGAHVMQQNPYKIIIKHQTPPVNRVNFQGGVFVDDWNLRAVNLVPLPSVANQVQNAGGRPNSRASALL